MQVRSQNALRDLMDVRGVSLRELAAGIGIPSSHSYLGRLTRGELRSIPDDRADAIAAYLNIDRDDLFVSRPSTAGDQIAHRDSTGAAA